MKQLPPFAVPILKNDVPLDDTGKKVLVTSIGGPTWPDDKFGRALQEAPGVVVAGPYHYWYVAQAKVEAKGRRRNDFAPRLKPQKFMTVPMWTVRLEGYNLEVRFTEKELEFQ